jgi:hypothetical protein
MKVYRVVSEDETRWYKSNQFRGFYLTVEQARNAIRHISGWYQARGVSKWKVQEAEVQWNDVA